MNRLNVLVNKVYNKRPERFCVCLTSCNPKKAWIVSAAINISCEPSAVIIQHLTTPRKTKALNRDALDLLGKVAYQSKLCRFSVKRILDIGHSECNSNAEI